MWRILIFLVFFINAYCQTFLALDTTLKVTLQNNQTQQYQLHVPTNLEEDHDLFFNV